MKRIVSPAFCQRAFQGKVLSHILGSSLRYHIAGSMFSLGSRAQNSGGAGDKGWRELYNARY